MPGKRRNARGNLLLDIMRSYRFDSFSCHCRRSVYALAHLGGGRNAFWLAKYLLGHIPDCALKQGSNPILNTAKQQLMAYFTGESKVLDVPLKLIGTTFRKSVWQALRTIPYGETRTYGQIAAQVGRPQGPRAVGQANHHNPISFFVP